MAPSRFVITFLLIYDKVNTYLWYMCYYKSGEDPSHCTHNTYLIYKQAWQRQFTNTKLNYQILNLLDPSHCRSTWVPNISSRWQREGEVWKLTYIYARSAHFLICRVWCAPSNCLGVVGAVWVVWVVGTAGCHWLCQLLQVQAFHDLYDRTADAEGGLAAGGCGSIVAAVQVQLPRRRPWHRQQQQHRDQQWQNEWRPTDRRGHPYNASWHTVSA